MPTVLRWGPYRAFFYSNERGEPPHGILKGCQSVLSERAHVG